MDPRNIVDTNFDVYSDTPTGKDPDSYSPTLRKYHQVLWSKPLPGGQQFNLDLETPRLLHHKSGLGEYYLSSDAIVHSYEGVKKMQGIISQVTTSDLRSFFYAGSTIGSYIIFPSKRVNNQMTINGARGVNSKIQDRFDLSLECIRRFYVNQESPLQNVFERYSSFFNLFGDFRGYVEFFLLQDLVTEGFESIRYWHPFTDFDNAPLPNDLGSYLSYRTKAINFSRSRNNRIDTYTNQLYAGSSEPLN